MSTTVDDEVEVENERTKEPVLIDARGESIPHADTEIRKRPLYRRPAFLIVAVIVLLIAAIFGIRYWLYSRSHESTDDAFIDAHITPVSPKVSGYIAKVH